MKRLFFLLPLLLTACGRPAAIDSAVTATSTPTPIASPEIVTTGGAANGSAIAVAVTAAGRTHRMQVVRGTSVFPLNASDSPDQYGCEIEPASYDTFGCYFPLEIQLVDLDADGEPEIVSRWEQDGSGGTKSFHLHKWDGNKYKLIGESVAMQLQDELQDLNDDGRPEIILRYHVGPHQLPTPWVDVYTLTQAQLIDASNEYPELYQELQEQYQALLPDYEAAASNGWSEALSALKQRIAMAEAITGSGN